eukprot:m51a1_g2750 hypothetical protein (860) ;mRNA; f:955243-959822
MRVAVVIAVALACTAHSYKPVVMIHGYGFGMPGAGTERDFAQMIGWLGQWHPGQPTYAIHCDDGDLSGKPLWTQIEDYALVIDAIIREHPGQFAEGFHLVGHSQGSLVSRGLIEVHGYDVDNYVTLAGIHSGTYGHCDPVLPGANVTCSQVTEALYTDEQQRSSSIANMWHDAADSELFLSKNVFLPVLNNEVETNMSDLFRKNIARVNNIHLLASPGDEAVVPWISGLWGFWDAGAREMLPMQQQAPFVKDVLGIRDLYEQGRVHLVEVPGVRHCDWMMKENVFRDYAITAAALCCAAAPHVWHLNDAVTRAITTERIQAHLRFLSDPLLEGRFAGSRGESLAANYIAAQLAANNVLPANGSSYFQAVPLTRGAKGVLFINIPSRTGYSWTAMQGAQGGSVVQSPSSLPANPVAFYAWASLRSTFKFSDFAGKSVVGIIPGRSRPHEAVVMSGHIDHIGTQNGTVTRDLIVVGRNTMTTDIVPKVFSKEGLIMTPDPVPQMGFLYRSDSFAFEQSGIPSIWVLQGTMYYGKPADYFSTVVTSYLMPPPLGRYHQPTDTFENIASFEGMEQQGRAALACAASAYKPVVMIHGFGFWVPGWGTDKDFNSVIGWLNQWHPGQPTYALKVNNEYQSSKDLWTQIDDFARALDEIIRQHPEQFAEGFHLVGHSQGSLVSRGLIEVHGYDVDNYITLAGVHNGLYGRCGSWFFHGWSCSRVTDFLYNEQKQKTLSVANMWREARNNTLFLEKNLFLPILNNEVETSRSDMFRKNLARVKNIHLFASPDDPAIAPWISGLWGFVRDDGTTLAPMQEQTQYVKDVLGLRTMYEQGRVHLTQVPHLGHNDWMKKEDVFKKHVFPLLV